jgi:hypothetical protein
MKSKRKLGKKNALALTAATVLMLSAMSVPTLADDGITLVVNGETVDFTGDQEPIIQNGRTLVPFRAAFEKMGAEVDWFSDIRLCQATYAGTTVGITIGDTKVSINDDGEVESDVPAQIINSRTMVPLRVLSESIGATVDWDNATRTVTVTTPQITGEAPEAVTYDTKTATVDGTVSKVTYSYPVVKDVYTLVDVLNKNLASDAESVATVIANENASGKDELTITLDVKENSAGLLSVMYLIDGEDVGVFHYGISDGAKMSDESYADAMYGGAVETNDDRYTIEDYTAYEKDDKGDTYINAIAYYPQFTGEADFIPSLNTQLENSAKKAVDSFVASYKDEAKELYATTGVPAYDYLEDCEVEISEDNIATIKINFTESVAGQDDRIGEDTIKVNLTTGEIL